MRRSFLPTTLLAALLCLGHPFSGDAHAREHEQVSLYARTLLEQINNYRIYNGLPPLRFDARLNHLARSHSFAMFRQKRMSHSGFDERFRRSGSRMCVENVGWNYSTPLKQFDSWRHSRGHDENMLKEGIHYAGIAEIGKYVTFFACR
jgi:uncharacterized protein YkwD